MRVRRGLRDEDFVQTLGTRDWQSYASVQLGIDQSRSKRTDVTRAHYAQAVDRDPDNLLAQFNLAGLEGWSSDPGDRQGAIVRLWWIHERLEWMTAARAARGTFATVHERFKELIHARASQPSSVNAKEGELAARGTDALDEARALKRHLLDCDPLHFQVVYKHSAFTFNDFVREAEPPPEALKNLKEEFSRLSLDLVLLEDVLNLLEVPDLPPSKQPDEPTGASAHSSDPSHALARARWLRQIRATANRHAPTLVRHLVAWWLHPFGYSRQGEALAELLRSCEGPLLVLWLSFNRHIDPEDSLGAAMADHRANPEEHPPWALRHIRYDEAQREAVRTDRVRNALITKALI